MTDLTLSQRLRVMAASGVTVTIELTPSEAAKMAAVAELPADFTTACRVLARDEAAIIARHVRHRRAAESFEASMRQCAVIGAYVVSVVICWGLFV